MARQDVEFFQNFVRRYVNRAIREHFRDIDDISEDSLSVDAPRQATKLLLLHKDTDTMTLTIGRLLFWWLETKGLLDECIYGIPSTEYEITHTYFPQVKLHFKEDKYLASTNNRRPARSEVSFRWRELDYTTTNINALANKIYNDFVSPVFYYQKGRTLYSYVDKSLGYFFNVTADSELDAKKIIEQTIRLQDEIEPDWEEFFKQHVDNKNYTIPGTVRVMGETIQKPKRRPIARVEFQYAELFISGMVKPIILVDRTGTKARPIRIG